MKLHHKLAFWGLCVWALGGYDATAIDPLYHDNAEIYAEIDSLQQLNPDISRIDTIGYSQRDGLPIWAMKISDNVNQDEDEPTVLFVGQVHAEELMGVEITLAMILDILTHRYQYNPYPYAIWLQTLEIWVVPTANPEGHQVVMDELDISYRKNKSDCNQNGIFDYSTQSVGMDSDGVDINRNFPLNWVHGDSYLNSSGNEPFDYFRGFSPLSESETQALWDLGEREKFAFSIVWHESRTTYFSEMVFYPWRWVAGKPSPDFDVIDSLGVQLAGMILKTTPGSYQAVPSGTAQGSQHDSFYASFGTIAFLIEAGPAIQSSYDIVEDVIAANLPGAYFLLNRACGYGQMTHSQLSGTVTDAITGSALPAVVTIPQLSGAYLAPRTCDPTYGRYRRYVLPSTYDIVVHMRGYYPQTRTGIFANPSGPPPYYNFALVPKPTHTLSGTVSDIGGVPWSCTLFVSGEDVADTVMVPPDGQFTHTLPEGEYRLIFDGPGYVVRYDSLNLDQNRYVEFRLSPATQVFLDDFEDGLGQWAPGGTNPNLIRWGTEAADSLWPGGGMVATESPDADYLPDVQNWIELAQPLDLANVATASLRFQHWYYFEPGYDYGQVEVSTDQGENWETIAGPFWGQDVGWETVYATLDPYCGLDDVRLRWLISTDVSMNEQGWRIDDVEIVSADTFVYAPPPIELPNTHALYSVYPNPFNSELTILLELPYEQLTKVTVWDIAGRKVDDIYDGRLIAGQHRLSWKAMEEQPSGVYLLRIESATKREIRKVVFLK